MLLLLLMLQLLLLIALLLRQLEMLLELLLLLHLLHILHMLLLRLHPIVGRLHARPPMAANLSGRRCRCHNGRTILGRLDVSQQLSDR